MKLTKPKFKKGDWVRHIHTTSYPAGLVLRVFQSTDRRDLKVNPGVWWVVVDYSAPLSDTFAERLLELSVLDMLANA